MKILLMQDKDVLPLKEISNRLNRISKNVTFETSSAKLAQDSSLSIQIREASELEKKIEKNVKQYDLLFLITERRYVDNFFYHKASKTVILSFAGWEFYTNLPIENGVVYFIAQILAKEVDNYSFRHLEKTGCLYDFLGNKTDVDLGMREGYICDECLHRLSETKLNEEKQLLLVDVLTILSSLANVSKLEKSFLDKYSMIKSRLDWRTFEDDVSQLYRSMGAKVTQNVNLAGFQIDILVQERNCSGQQVRSAVECKFYRGKVGFKIINDFARKILTLMHNGLVDKGILVSWAGFTPQAQANAKATGIELKHYEEIKLVSLDQAKRQPSNTLESIIAENEKAEQEKVQSAPNVFVIMPFSKELDDLYYLGIAETVRKVGCTCNRVDQIDFVGEIMDKIYDSINNSKVIIAELSQPNTNVYYELGYAHAKNKLTILITKDISKASFDVKGYNSIIYENIIDLKKKLEKRLESIL